MKARGRVAAKGARLSRDVTLATEKTNQEESGS